MLANGTQAQLKAHVRYPQSWFWSLEADLILRMFVQVFISLTD